MKKSFKLPVWPEGFCDIHVCGKKVSHAFGASLDNIAVKVPEWVTQDMVEKVPHDPRVELAPRGADKYFELEVKNEWRKDVGNQVPTERADGRSEVDEQDGDNPDKNVSWPKPNERGFKSSSRKTR
jgi:hypothetical protein